MSENFHVLTERGKKCWEAVKQELQVDPDTISDLGARAFLSSTLLNERSQKFLATVKQEIKEHPKTDMAAAATAVFAAFIFRKELMAVFPAEKELLASIKEAEVTRTLSERVVPITAVDRAVVLKGIQRAATMPRVEGLSNVVSITAVKTPRASGGMTELLNDIKRQTAGSEGAARTAFSQDFYGKLAPSAAGAGVNVESTLSAHSAAPEITSSVGRSSSPMMSHLTRANLYRASNLHLVTEVAHTTR